MANLVKTVAKNSSYAFVSNLIAGLIMLAINIYIARYLGKEVFGDYSFVIAYISFFLILANLGIDSIVTREMSRNQKQIQKYINVSLTLKAMLAVLSIMLACLIILPLPYTYSVKLGVMFASITLIFYASTATLTCYFQSRMEMIYAAISNVLAKVVFAGLIFYVVSRNGGFIQLIIALGAGLLMQSLLLFFIVGKRIKLRFEIDRELSKKIFKEAIPLAMVGLFVSLYYRLDVMMLSLMKDEAAVGLYSAAYNLTEAPTIIPAALMVSIFPLMSIYYKTSKNELKKVYEISMKYMLLLALPLAAGTTLLSARIIHIVYGDAYAASAIALSILIWTTVFVFAGIVNASMLVATERQITLTKISLLLLIINTVINLILIPDYSFIGASFASLIAQGMGVIISSYILCRSTGAKPLKKLVGIIGATMGMCMFIYLAPMNIILTIIISITIYLLLLLIFRVLDVNDMKRFKNILAK